MEAAVVLVLVLVGLLVVFKVVGGLMSLISVAISGLFIGALARWILPGRQDMSWLHTLGYGLAGALIGRFVGQFAHMGSLLTWALQIAVAVALIAGREQLRLPKG
jgi:uncharacterized membrane protein YeaQ/YmgE (transglycosylase-associated protein family)